MHVTWVVTIGEIVTWFIAIAGFCYTFGRLTARVDSVDQNVDEHRSDFTRHEQSDVERFEAINARVATLSNTLIKSGGNH